MSILNKIKRIGIFQTIDDITGNRIQYINYLLHRLSNKPYFGAYLASKQGKSIRHFYMQELVKHYCNSQSNLTHINIVEIGSWAGGSAITWAEAISKYNNDKGKVFCIDPWEDYFSILDKYSSSWIIQTMIKSTKNNKIFKLFIHNIINSKYSKNISILKGKSNEMFCFLKPESFDIIFIDGSHSYIVALADIGHYTSLVKENGIICGDDLELQYSKIDIKKAQDLKSTFDTTIDPKTNKKYHPGVTVAVHDFFNQEVSVWEGFWAMQKKNSEWKPIIMNINNREIEIPKHLK